MNETPSSIFESVSIKSVFRFPQRLITGTFIRMSASRVIDLTREDSAQDALLSNAAAPAVASFTASAKRTPKRKPSSPKEKRLRRYRSKPTNAIQERILRAQRQTMFLISKEGDDTEACSSCKFVVLGSTGNVYDVTIQKVPHCTCPDHAKGNLCKHILFVLLKVMRVPSTSPLIYQAAWLESELKELFEGMRLRYQQVSGVLANAAVQESYKKLKGGSAIENSSVTKEDETTQDSNVRRREEDEDCPICFDTLGDSATTYCKTHCGATFHLNCIQHWKRQQRGSLTCPLCRGAWEEKASSSTASAPVQENEGYTNLGRLQGQSPDRDTSSYHSRWDGSYSRGYKRRRWH